jgi:hypothetical protein
MTRVFTGALQHSKGSSASLLAKTVTVPNSQPKKHPPPADVRALNGQMLVLRQTRPIFGTRVKLAWVSGG